MGFGKLFGSGPTAEQQAVQKIQQANQKIVANQAAGNAASSALRPTIAASAATKLATAVNAPDPGTKLGILDFIKTSPSGLRNQPKTGRLSLLGN